MNHPGSRLKQAGLASALGGGVLAPGLRALLAAQVRFDLLSRDGGRKRYTGLCRIALALITESPRD